MDRIKKKKSKSETPVNRNKLAVSSLPTETYQDVVYKLPLSVFGVLTVSLPLFSLIFCFLTAFFFQHEAVTETECHVENYIPSISGITGASPQRYLWRISVALHSTPRFAVGFIYYNHYISRINVIADKHKSLYKRLVSLNFWLHTLENTGLVGVTFIANYENYPIHEKLFIVFMISSLCYQCLTITIFRWCYPTPMPEDIARSYGYKKLCFVLILSFTAGLIYFFLRHRLFCEPHAFSFFSICEYGIAITNICFHYTATIDFRGHYWALGIPTNNGTNNHHSEKNE